MSGAPAVGRKLVRGALGVLAGVLLLAAAYTWGALSFDYSTGERAGALQKFSRKGWVCKTYEGELALYVVAGVQPEIWEFTVRDPALAEALARAVGQRVQLHYAEHRGIPTSCFGDTRYFVDRVTPLGEVPAILAPAAR